MSSDSFSWTFAIRPEDVPAKPFTSRDPKFSALFERYTDDDYVYATSRHYYAKTSINALGRAHSLTGLKYIDKHYALLDPKAIKHAIGDFKFLLDFFRDKPEETAEFFLSELSGQKISEAMSLPLLELRARADRDRDQFDRGSFYGLIFYIENNLFQLQHALDERCYVLYILYAH
jgi:hypothetical protein